VALAGVIVSGVDISMVVLSAHAEVFGVGTTVVVGSMLVLPSSVISGCIVPSGGFAGISGVESLARDKQLDGAIDPGTERRIVRYRPRTRQAAPGVLSLVAVR
jgi:hypothetical protein